MRKTTMNCPLCNRNELKESGWIKPSKDDKKRKIYACKICGYRTTEQLKKDHTNKKRIIIHKHLLKRGQIRYACNQACNTNWKKTDITNKKINCKNCKKILRKNHEKNN
jgi:hypothetical protein